MGIDTNAADDPSAFAVLLHPHPDYGGNRIHPFIDSLFEELPRASVSAIRFDFTSAEPAGARDQVDAAIDVGAGRWADLPAVLVGYSFGAGIAASVDDPRVAGWYLLAPPAPMLADATIGNDPRPKALLVPESDQFSPPTEVEQIVAGWRSATVDILAGSDHFLGAVRPTVDHALGWVRSLLGT